MGNSYEDILEFATLYVNAAKIKSNDPMPARSKKNIAEFVEVIESWDSPHRNKAVKFANEISYENLFEILHGMRRWYSGQTMARMLKAYRKDLKQVMDLEPDEVVGIYRGFKVYRDNPLAQHEKGDEFSLPIKRNHGFSSWSTTEAPTHKFSGKSKDKVGIVIKLIDSKGITPILAPPSHTRPWFNALYEHVIGTSFRPKEGEYLIFASSARVKVIQMKR